MSNDQRERIHRFVGKKHERVKEYEVREEPGGKALVISNAGETVPAEILRAIIGYHASHVRFEGTIDRRDCSRVAHEFEHAFTARIAPQLQQFRGQFARYRAMRLHAGKEGGPVMPFYARGFDWHIINAIESEDGGWCASIDLTAKYTMPSMHADVFIVVEKSLSGVQRTLAAITGETWTREE